MAKKTAKEKKALRKRSREHLADVLHRLAANSDGSDGEGDELSTTTMVAADVAIEEEEAIGDVAQAFDALAERHGARAGLAAGIAAARDDQGVGAGDEQGASSDTALRRHDDGFLEGDDALHHGSDAAADAASARHLRLAKRPSIAELKVAARFPDSVELHDEASPEPFLLVHLKGYRNTIRVPPHWCKKGSFLSNEVSRDVVADDIMPPYIEKTGVAAMRDRAGKDDDLIALARPYLEGHPKPGLTAFGDVFYEGKDLRARFRRFKPGLLSDRLRHALGMTAPTHPPPWLYGMQAIARLPPAYPAMSIPGLNAPLPAGCRWGRARGEWGEPPRDSANKLVFPSVMAVGGPAASPDDAVAYWGVLTAQSVAASATSVKAPTAPASESASGSKGVAERIVTERVAPTPLHIPAMVGFAAMPPHAAALNQQTTFAVEMTRHAGGLGVTGAGMVMPGWGDPSSMPVAGMMPGLLPSQVVLGAPVVNPVRSAQHAALQKL